MNPIPDHDTEGLALYRDHGIRPGGFLVAVLTNDLRGAVARADEVNREALPDIVTWCEENLPMVAWGSTKRVEAWIKHGADAHAAVNDAS